MGEFSVGLLSRSRPDVHVPRSNCLDDSLNGPGPCVIRDPGNGRTHCPTHRICGGKVRGNTKPGDCPQCGWPTMRESPVPCGSGWFSQTIHLGKESREILLPGRLRRALGPELSGNQSGRHSKSSPRMVRQGQPTDTKATGPSILLCLGPWPFLTAPSRQGLLSDPCFKSSIPG